MVDRAEDQREALRVFSAVMAWTWSFLAAVWLVVAAFGGGAMRWTFAVVWTAIAVAGWILRRSLRRRGRI